MRQGLLATYAVGAYVEGDEDALALLTPLNYGDQGEGGQPKSMEELYQELSEADGDQLARLLIDVTHGAAPEPPERFGVDHQPLPRDPDALYAELRSCFGAGGGKQLLADRLRRAQGIPPRGNEEAMRRLRQQIDDTVQDLKTADHGTVFSLLNTRDSVLRAADVAGAPTAAKILDYYDGLIQQPVSSDPSSPLSSFKSPGFAKQLLSLIEKFPIGSMRFVLSTLGEALGADYRAPVSSCSKEHLRVLNWRFSNFTAFNTVLEAVQKLHDSLNRQMRVHGQAPSLS